MIATREPTSTAVLAARLERDKIFSWLGLGCALLVSALLNLWNLAQNGYGNTFYAVAVQSMLQSFHNFFYGSYDAGGFITVDKPPVALWIETLSAKIFGFSGLAILVPEALAGGASVALLYFLVRRLFGTLAGFLAALALAITPVAVAIERSNNVDTWLMFTVLLAAWAMTFATEKGRLSLLLLAMALVGVAFNIKMLEAFIVLPAFYLLYLLAARVSWPKRIVHLALASVVVFGVALSWPLAVDLTPPDQRPYIGGSQTNSVLNLALGYNGLGRVTGQGERFGRDGNNQDAGNGLQGLWSDLQSLFSGQSGANGNRGGFGGGGFGGGMFNSGTPGPGRLLGPELAGQWSWLFPLALFGLLAAGFGLRRKLPRGTVLSSRGQALLLWGGWLVMYGLVFSFASGIFHSYYLVMLAPPVAALLGAGVATLWGAYRLGGWRAWLLPLALFVTAIWQMKVLSDYPQWSGWLTLLLFGGSTLAAVGLVLTRLLSVRAWRRWAPGLLGVGLVALLVSPAAWSLTPVFTTGNGTMPSAGPTARNQFGGRGGFGGGGGFAAAPGQPGGDIPTGSGLISYLETNRDGYFYLVAVGSANQASPIALETGQPVLAMGGFSGGDPAMTVEKLQQMIVTKQVRFILGGMGGFGGFGGPGGGSSSVNSWIASNCQAVSPSQYGGQSGGGGFGGFRGGGQLYDCGPQAG